MRKSVFISLLSVLIFSVSSCSDKKSGIQSQDLVTIDVPLQADQSTQLPRISELFQVTDVILSASSIESLVGNIYEIKYSGDTLFILSGDALLLFKTDGRFIAKIDKQGRGHGEYVDLIGFEIDQKNNNILIFDRFGVLRYTMDGKFIDKAPIKGMPLEFALLPSGDYVFYSPSDFDGLKGLWITDSKGNYKRHLLTLEEYDLRIFTGSKKLTQINDSVIGFMGPENPDYFYHITDDTIIPAFYITSQLLNSKVKMDEVEFELPAYTKSSYCESDELFTFILIGTADNIGIRVFYNKKTGQIMFLHTTNKKASSDSDYKIPSFVNSYKNCMFSFISVGKILKDENFKAQFPGITEDSNPVIQIYRSK